MKIFFVKILLLLLILQVFGCSNEKASINIQFLTEKKSQDDIVLSIYELLEKSGYKLVSTTQSSPGSTQIVAKVIIWNNDVNRVLVVTEEKSSRIDINFSPIYKNKFEKNKLLFIDLLTGFCLIGKSALGEAPQVNSMNTDLNFKCEN